MHTVWHVWQRGALHDYVSCPVLIRAIDELSKDTRCELLEAALKDIRSGLSLFGAGRFYRSFASGFP